MAMVVCTECGSTYDDSLTVSKPYPDKSCYKCGTVFTDEQIAAIIADPNTPTP